ncbi:MAG: hypothetical protein AB1515_09770 [Nitrospirota bacterium]
MIRAVRTGLLLAAIAAPLAAEAAGGPLHLEAGADLKYDDLAIYVINPATGRVATKGDVIAEPFVTLSYTTPGRLPTKWLIDITADFYARHSILNYQTIRLLMKQSLTPAASLAVKYTLIPEIFFGDDVMGPGLPVGDQTYQVHVLQATADRDFGPGLNAALTGKYAIRDAESAFEYRDVTVWGAAADAVWRPAPRTKVTVGAAYEHDAAKGGRNFFSGRPDDATYDQYTAFVALARSFGKTWQATGRYRHRWRLYATDLAGDVLHHGRTDRTDSFLIEAVYRLTDSVHVKAGYESIWRDSTRSYARYHENISTLGVNYRF